MQGGDCSSRIAWWGGGIVCLCAAAAVSRRPCSAAALVPSDLQQSFTKRVTTVSDVTRPRGRYMAASLALAS